MVSTSAEATGVRERSQPCGHWLCPDIRPYWQLAKLKSDNRIILRSPQSGDRHIFSAAEGYALRHFVGKYTIDEIQQRCQQELTVVDSELVAQLVTKLLQKGIFAWDTPASDKTPRLKPCVEWIENADGYWILRNPEDRTYLQVSARDRAAIATRVGDAPPNEATDIDPQHWRKLLQLLAATGMLEGTAPQKPKRGKFNPLQLLFFKVPLWNPDRWLEGHIDKLRWLWTQGSAFSLLLFLSASAIVGFSRQSVILDIGAQLWNQNGSALMFPFVLLVMGVVSIHELGHAFTLKHYGGLVPEVGLLFMCLFPAAYTNTSDSYCLSRWQRIQVVAAGVLTQIAIAAIAFWAWQFSVQGSGLYVSSYLLMVASLFTVALNLNPLAKFDGYHLAVAVTGINNLRSRSFGFYKNLLQGKPLRETREDCRILAIYAPFSLMYVCGVFGFLFLRLTHWTLTNIPAIAAFALSIWAIYYFLVPEES